MQEPNPLDVTCPNCGQGPGYPCMNGFVLPTAATAFEEVEPHPERVAVAKQQAAQGQ